MLDHHQSAINEIVYISNIYNRVNREHSDLFRSFLDEQFRNGADPNAKTIREWANDFIESKA